MSHEFEEIGPRTLLLHAHPLDGEPLILFGMIDITERKKNEEARELLARELSHRVKNVFAVIQALATQTNGHIQSVEASKRPSSAACTRSAASMAFCSRRNGKGQISRSWSRMSLAVYADGQSRADRGRWQDRPAHAPAEPGAQPGTARARHQRRQVRGLVEPPWPRARCPGRRSSGRRRTRCVSSGRSGRPCRNATVRGRASDPS